jgi:hypothetical protein
MPLGFFLILPTVSLWFWIVELLVAAEPSGIAASLIPQSH